MSLDKNNVKITFEGDSDTLLRILSGAWSRPSMTEWEEDAPDPMSRMFEPSEAASEPGVPLVFPQGPSVSVVTPAPRVESAARTLRENREFQNAIASGATFPSTPSTGVGDWHEPALDKHAQTGPAGGNLPSMNLPPDFNFGALPLKEEAWEAFRHCVLAWVENFDGPVDADGTPLMPQPNRLQLLTDIGSGRWPLYILRWIAHYKSLQGAVLEALGTVDLDLVDRVSANIVQVSHIAFPDIAGFHDYSTKWSRS